MGLVQMGSVRVLLTPGRGAASPTLQAFFRFPSFPLNVRGCPVLWGATEGASVRFTIVAGQQRRARSVDALIYHAPFTPRQKVSRPRRNGGRRVCFYGCCSAFPVLFPAAYPSLVTQRAGVFPDGGRTCVSRSLPSYFSTAPWGSSAVLGRLLRPYVCHEARIAALSVVLRVDVPSTYAEEN